MSFLKESMPIGEWLGYASGRRSLEDLPVLRRRRLGEGWIGSSLAGAEDASPDSDDSYRVELSSADFDYQEALYALALDQDAARSAGGVALHPHIERDALVLLAGMREQDVPSLAAEPPRAA